MKSKFIILLMIGAASIMASCKKDNKTGPVTTGGSTITLNTGNGSKIYSGHLDPPASLGKTGDFYINLTTDMFFGPKTPAGWGTSIALNAIGTIPGGGTMYSGSGAPASTLGITGDFYLDTVAYMLYGPKTVAGWGTPVSVQRPGTNPGVESDVFTLANSDWLWNSQYLYETGNGSYTEYFTRYNVHTNSTITQDVLNNGMVLVYMQSAPQNYPNQWSPVPYQFDSGFGYLYNYVYVTDVGQVTLHFFFTLSDPSATAPTLSNYPMDTREFKVVTVTGQAAFYMTQHHINVNDYKAVMKVTGLWQTDKSGL